MSETSPRYQTKQNDVPSDKREAILDAALELFAERGFHGTAVPLVAKRANVGAGTIYRYFESKEALVNALYQRWKGRVGQRILEGFPLEASPREQLRAYWQRMCAFIQEHPQAFKFLELHHHGPYLDGESRALERTILEPARAFVEMAQTQGLLKSSSPEVLIAVVYGSLLGLVKASWSGYLDLTREVLDQGESCVWEAIRA